MRRVTKPYRGVRGGEEGSVGEAAWETWWSGSGSSCCSYDNCKTERERERESVRGRDTRKHERIYCVVSLPQQSCARALRLWACCCTFRWVRAGEAGTRNKKHMDHCRSTTAIRRIQFPQSSIPVCLLSAKIRNDGGGLGVWNKMRGWQS